MAQTNTPGRFVHYDLMTTDLDTSQAFFTELFDWEVNNYEIPGSGIYPMLKNSVREFGGMVTLDGSNGQSSHWMSYISTPDVDALCERATALGGAVQVPPMDIPDDYGRFAVIADPQGAVFAVYASEQASDDDPTVAAGGVDWNELVTGDPEAAAAFYGDLFGYEAEVMNGDAAGSYTVLSAGGVPVGGILKKTEEMNMPASVWMPYFRVDDIDAAAADITRLGGILIAPPFEVAPNGKFAWAADPAGAAFNLHEPDPASRDESAIGG